MHASASPATSFAALGAADATVTLSQAGQLIRLMAHEHSFLLLAPPGVGKSDLVAQAAQAAGLPCRSLLGTQVAPEDVSGIPRIVGERAVFCPPRLLLPERPEPFCLFLDELPACAPDVQKALYSLLLERRLGEHALPAGSWVVAAGNRMQDRALVRAMSSALVNRVTILHVRVDVDEWLAWAEQAGVRADVRAFVSYVPEALMRGVPADPVPFSTPRAWASLARALDLADAGGLTDPAVRRALAFGRLSPQDAAAYCALAEENMPALQPLAGYLHAPHTLPVGETGRWFILDCIRQQVRQDRLGTLDPAVVDRFLRALSDEQQLTVLTDLVDRWGALGANDAMFDLLARVARL
jgi:MoxR-like ATPase